MHVVMECCHCKYRLYVELLQLSIFFKHSLCTLWRSIQQVLQIRQQEHDFKLMFRLVRVRGDCGHSWKKLKTSVRKWENFW